MEKKIYGYTRCWKCGAKLGYTDDYGDWAKFEKDRTGRVHRAAAADYLSKSEARWFDPDFVIEHHLRTECSSTR